MTIIFLCPSFYPKIGGVEKHALEIAKKIGNKNKVIVITQDDKNKKEVLKRITIYRFYFGKKDWFRKFRIWKKLWDRRDLIKKADIIHCHDVFFWYLPFRFLFLKKKVYATFHGYETVYPPTFKSILIRKLSEKLSRGNVCVGSFIEKWYGTKPNFVTYGATDQVKIQKLKVKSKSSKFKILFIGRIEKDTGVEIYSKALKSLKNYSFEACGDGSLRREFEKFGKVYGFVQNLNNYISKSDIIFASSYLSILEALSFRKPVFSVYDNPLKRDYLRMTPFSKSLEITNSAADLRNKINKFKKNPKFFEKNISKVYEWVSGETWERLAKTYLDLYKL